MNHIFCAKKSIGTQKPSVLLCVSALAHRHMYGWRDSRGLCTTTIHPDMQLKHDSNIKCVNQSKQREAVTFDSLKPNIQLHPLYHSKSYTTHNCWTMNKATTAYHYDSKTMHMDILHLAVVIAGFYPNVLPYSNW